MTTFPKRNRSNRFLLDMARFSHNSGAVVDWGSDCDDWVCISAKGQDDIYMQGDEAREFMAEVEMICKRYRSFDDYTAALVVAKQFIECIWS